MPEILSARYCGVVSELISLIVFLRSSKMRKLVIALVATSAIAGQAAAEIRSGFYLGPFQL